MKYLFILLFVISQNGAFAANKSLKNLSHGKKADKANPFSLEFLLTTEQTKQIVNKNMDGTYSKFDTSLLQTLTKNDQIRYFLATRYINTKSDNFGNEFEMFFFELLYRRKAILNHEQHGINLDFELKNYWIIDEDIRERYGYNGSFIPQVILKKSWSRKFSTKLKVRRHFFQTNSQNEYVLNFEDRIYLSATSYLTRGWMANAQIKYQHKQRKGNEYDPMFYSLLKETPWGAPDFSDVPEAKKHQELVTLHTGVMHLFNRKTMLEVYGETKLSNTYDKRDLETITKDEFVFGTALYLTAF